MNHLHSIDAYVEGKAAFNFKDMSVSSLVCQQVCRSAIAGSGKVCVLVAAKPGSVDAVCAAHPSIVKVRQQGGLQLQQAFMYAGCLPACM